MVEAALAEVRGIPVRDSGRKERHESMMNLGSLAPYVLDGRRFMVWDDWGRTDSPDSGASFTIRVEGLCDPQPIRIRPLDQWEIILCRLHPSREP
jgi:hypothetical protein